MTKGKIPFAKTNLGFILINALIAFIVSAILIVSVLMWLSNYARHGEEIEVPDLMGLYIEEAMVLAQNQGMTVMVVDSTYSKKTPLGAIVDQNPQANSKAKRDRTIYVVMNAKQVRQIPVPDLRDLSYRQAETTLKSIGLTMDEIVYEPSVYKDLVLDMKHNGVSINPGTRLPEGTKVTLVVGFGAGTEQVRTPDLLGQSIASARSYLLEHRLILGSVEYDEEMTEENANSFVVYEQSTRAGVEILEGSRIDIKVTTSLEKAASAAAEEDEEDFF